MQSVHQIFSIKKLCIIVGMLFFFSSCNVVFADVVNSFSIDTLNQPTITSAMLTKNREKAVAHATELIRQKTDPSIGNAVAPVLLVEFMDFSCPLSEKMDPEIRALVKKNSNFRVIYKIVPQYGKVSVFAAKAALAANVQGKYTDFHMALMKAGKTLNQEKVIAIAKSVGIDIAKLKADMNNQQISQQLDENTKLFNKLSLKGTPVLFFMKSSLTEKANQEDVIVLMGIFTQAEIQEVIQSVAVS